MARLDQLCSGSQELNTYPLTIKCPENCKSDFGKTTCATAGAIFETINIFGFEVTSWNGGVFNLCPGYFNDFSCRDNKECLSIHELGHILGLGGTDPDFNSFMKCFRGCRGKKWLH